MDRKMDRPGHEWLGKCEDLGTEPMERGTQTHSVKETLREIREFHLNTTGRQRGC